MSSCPPYVILTAAHPQVRHILDRLVDGVAEILADRLIGIYLYGSLVSGDFDPDVSDLDLVAVMTRDLNDVAFRSLHHLHQQVIADYPNWDNRLELAYLSREALKTFRSKTSRIGIISPGEPFHQIDAGSDWIISWYLLRETGIPLRGRPLKSLIDPISPSEYLQAVKEHIETYRHSVKTVTSKSWMSYIILTTVRGVYTLRMGTPTSKIKAAVWAVDAFPAWSELIEKALIWRRNPDADPLTADDIRPQAQAFVCDLLA